MAEDNYLTEKKKEESGYLCYLPINRKKKEEMYVKALSPGDDGMRKCFSFYGVVFIKPNNKKKKKKW